jgi:methylmalonyl-CoA/ethylmalonyl-CoA epimerase
LKQKIEVGNIDHVGIVVPSIEQAIKHYEKNFNVQRGEIKVSKKQQVKISLLEFKNIRLELIEPLNKESPINGFLSKNPLGGLHHLGLEVNNIDKTYEIAENLELDPIGKPSEGYHGKLLFFLHPKKMMNTLIEIISKH